MRIIGHWWFYFCWCVGGWSTALLVTSFVLSYFYSNEGCEQFLYHFNLHSDTDYIQRAKSLQVLKHTFCNRVLPKNPGSKGFLLWTRIQVVQQSGCWSMMTGRKLDVPSRKCLICAGKNYQSRWKQPGVSGLPQAVPRVDLAVIQVVLLAGVEHKLPFMGSIFL